MQSGSKSNSRASSKKGEESRDEEQEEPKSNPTSMKSMKVSNSTYKEEQVPAAAVAVPEQIPLVEEIPVDKFVEEVKKPAKPIVDPVKKRHFKAAPREKQDINIVWFRRNLRMHHDNPAFINACKDGLPVLCMYILSPYMTPKSKKKKRQKLQGTGLICPHGPSDYNACGLNWFQFLLSSLTELKINLQKYGQDLWFFQETENFVFRFLCENYKIRYIFAEQDLEPYGMNRDNVISQFIEPFGAKMITYPSGSLYDPRDVFRFSKQELVKDGVEIMSEEELEREMKEMEDNLNNLNTNVPSPIITVPRAPFAGGKGKAKGKAKGKSAVPKVSAQTAAVSSKAAVSLFDPTQERKPSLIQRIIPESQQQFEELVKDKTPPEPAHWTSDNVTKWKKAKTVIGKEPKSFLDWYRVELEYFIQREGFRIPEQPKGLYEEPFSNIGKNTIPSLKDLNLADRDTILVKFQGGESEGLKRLEFFLNVDTSRVLNYDRNTINPILRDANFKFYPSSLGVSAYISMGCLSVRTLYTEIQRVWAANKMTKRSHLIENLLWRDYFYFCGFGIENFGQLWRNPIVRQIPWEHDTDYLLRWENGRTGYPLIDAIMNQLKAEGWVHHLLKQIACCFLSRGNLYQSWERGRDIFSKYSIDNDWALNTGNWVAGSCACFDENFQDVFSPVEIGKDLDPNGDYIRYYVPQLRKMPRQYIFAPWEAPLEIQEAVGCKIGGKNYPSRIAFHEQTSEINFNITKRVFEEAHTKNWSLRAEALDYVKYQANTPEQLLNDVRMRKKLATTENPNPSAMRLSPVLRSKQPGLKEVQENDLLAGGVDMYYGRSKRILVNSATGEPIPNQTDRSAAEKSMKKMSEADKSMRMKKAMKKKKDEDVILDADGNPVMEASDIEMADPNLQRAMINDILMSPSKGKSKPRFNQEDDSEEEDDLLADSPRAPKTKRTGNQGGAAAAKSNSVSKATSGGESKPGSKPASKPGSKRGSPRGGELPPAPSIYIPTLGSRAAREPLAHQDDGLDNVGFGGVLAQQLIESTNFVNNLQKTAARDESIIAYAAGVPKTDANPSGIGKNTDASNGGANFDNNLKRKGTGEADRKGKKHKN